MKLSRTSTLLFACLLAGVTGCESSSSSTGPAAPGSEPVIVEPVVLRDIPLPPGVAPEDLAPRAGTALTKAQLPLVKVMDDIPRPAWALVSATQPATQASEPPLQAQKAYMQAKSDIREARYYEAINKLTEANRLAPGSPEILRSLGEASLLSGNSGRAANYFQQILEQNPNDPEALFMLGNIAVEQGNWVTAVWAYQKVLAQPPRPGTTDQAVFAVSSYNIAGALEKLGYDQGAIDALDKILSQQNTDLTATARLNRQTRALRSQKDSILISIGDANCRLGKPETAIGHYKRAIADADDLLIPSQAYPRLIYAQLRASQKLGAQATVMEMLGAGRFDAPTIALVDYYAKSGGDLSALQAKLESVYQSKGQSADLAIAISRLMQNPARHDFLLKHLQGKPQDVQVFDELTRDIATSDTKLSGNPALTKQLLQAASGSIAAVPDRAQGIFARLKLIDPTGATILPVAASMPADPGIGFVKAGFLAEQGKTAEAVTQYQAVVASAPNLLPARLALVRLLLTTGDIQGASKAIEPVETQEKTGVTQLRVMILIAQGKPKDALALVNKLLESQPGNVDLTVQRAELQFALTDYTGAERTLLDGIDQKPTTEIYYEKLFEIYDSGRINDAVNQYRRLMRRLLSTLPQSRLARLQQARLQLVGNQIQPAVETLQMLLRQNPKDAGALSLLLEAHVAAGRVDEANQLAAKAVTDFPGEREMLVAARNHYARTRQLSLYYQTAEKALALDPASPARSVQYAQLYLEQKQFDKAIGVLKPIIAQAREPLLTQARYTLARAYLFADQPAQAHTLLADVMIANASQPDLIREVSSVYVAALVADKTKTADQKVKLATDLADQLPASAADLLDKLASMFDAFGDRNTAQKLRVDALVKNPTHPGLNNNLAYVWAVEGINLDKSLMMIETTLAQEPDTDSYIDTKGWILYKSGKFKEAVEQLRRAHKAGESDSSVVIDHLGDALYRLGDKAQALQAWREAVTVRVRERARAEQAKQNVGSLPAWAVDQSNDPEMRDIDQRLKAKIEAAQKGTPAPVAPLGKGVVVPQQP
jgi:tetratricopeptide (TPR) repeat protein